MVHRFPSIVCGNVSGPALVLIAGFPDDQLSAWNAPFLDALKEKYHVFALCLPDYDNSWNEAKPWGHSFDDLVNGLHETLEALVKDRQFYLVAHDWGSVVAQLYENRFPERIKKLVLLDVGQMLKPSVIDVIRILSYQWWFASAYFWSQLFGLQVGNFIFYAFFVLCPKFLRCTPTDVIRRKGKPTVQLCYPYYQFWKSNLSGRLVEAKFPKVPTLFLYGNQKATQFHGPKFLSKLATTPNCGYVEMDAGHWITHFQPTRSFELISEFCK